MGKLTATAVKAAKAAGRYGDGDGPLSSLSDPLARVPGSLRVQKDGKRRDIGLGSAVESFPRRIARERASKARSVTNRGWDSILLRSGARRRASRPFREAAALVHAETRKAGWRNGKHNKQWLSSLEAHCFPAHRRRVGGRTGRPRRARRVGIDLADQGQRRRGVSASGLSRSSIGRSPRAIVTHRWQCQQSISRSRARSAATSHHEAMAYRRCARFHDQAALARIGGPRSRWNCWC